MPWLPLSIPKRSWSPVMINTRKWFSRDAWGAGCQPPGCYEKEELRTEFFWLKYWIHVLFNYLVIHPWKASRHFELNLNGEGKGFQCPLRYQVVQWNLAGFSKCTQLGPLVTLGAWITHAVDEVDWLFLNQRPNTYKTIHTVYVCMSICCILYTVCRVLNVCVSICCTLYTT